MVAGHQTHELIAVFVLRNLDSDCLGALTSADLITWIKVKTDFNNTSASLCSSLLFVSESEACTTTLVWTFCKVQGWDVPWWSCHVFGLSSAVLFFISAGLNLCWLQYFRFKNAFCIDCSCVDTRTQQRRVYITSREHDQNPHADLPATEMTQNYCTFKWKWTVWTAEGCGCERTAAWGRDGLQTWAEARSGSAPLLSACFCLWGRGTVCCLPSLKEALLMFF